MDNTTYCDPLQKIILETIAKKRGFRIDESLLENERVSMVTVEDIEKALESEPTNVDLLFARGSAYFNGDFQEAINSYSLGLLQEPFSTKLRYMRGRKYVSLDRSGCADPHDVRRTDIPGDQLWRRNYRQPDRNLPGSMRRVFWEMGG